LRRHQPYWMEGIFIANINGYSQAD